MKIDKRLNLVQPVETDLGTIHVHSTPVSRETFERYAALIAKTFGYLYQEVGTIGAPRIAAISLKQMAQATNQWDGPAGVENGLMNEIRRLTNVILPGANGWEMAPFDSDKTRSILSADDIAEVENVIVFFIVNSAMLRRAEQPVMLATEADLWGGQVTSFSATEYRNSLPTLSATATSPATEAEPPRALRVASSVPY